MSSTTATTGVHVLPTTLTARIRRVLVDSWVVTRISLLHFKALPDELILGLFIPVIIVVLFGYVVGSAIALPGGGNYREYLMPGAFVMMAAFTLPGTAGRMASDKDKGLIDRYRSLPMARSSVLVGHTLAQILVTCSMLASTVVCGLIVGWRADEGVWQAAAAFGILLLFGLAMNLIGTYVGLLVRTPEAASAVTFPLMFSLSYLANTFVPTGGLPIWLKPIAEWNPVSAVVTACRELFGNGPSPVSDAWPLQHPIIASIGWSLLILAVVMPLAIRRYRGTT